MCLSENRPVREFREATLQDNLDISKISVESWKFAYKGIMPNSTLDALDYKTRATYRSTFLEGTSLSTYMCIVDGRPVGFVDFELCRDDDCNDQVGEIWAIYVLPEVIGNFIGKELFRLAADNLAKKGCIEITVWVLSENKLARAFYERQGFLLDGVEKEYQGLLEVRYKKILEPNT
jgi:ribosomal protein S18 acetylase RimI-like enzyme